MVIAGANMIEDARRKDTRCAGRGGTDRCVREGRALSRTAHWAHMFPHRPCPSCVSSVRRSVHAPSAELCGGLAVGIRTTFAANARVARARAIQQGQRHATFLLLFTSKALATCRARSVLAGGRAVRGTPATCDALRCNVAGVGPPLARWRCGVRVTPVRLLLPRRLHGRGATPGRWASLAASPRRSGTG